MENTAKTSIRRADKILRFSMFSTMVTSLIIISVIALIPIQFCDSVKVTSKEKVMNKFFYSLSDGIGVWSNSNLEINDLVCKPSPNKEIYLK
jgi:hypothetical protein